MEERKEVIARFVSRGMSVDVATSIASMPKSTYYYRPNGRKKGKSPSTVTLKNNGLVEDPVLLKDMEQILGHEFNDYGYERTTMELRNRGYCINKKKIYRIMKENRWLLPATKKARANKTYVKYTSPLTDYPLEVIEIDVKYVYIGGAKRNAYFISLLDTFSRYVLEWVLEYNMKAERAMELIQRLVREWGIKAVPKITVRTDNGSQFIAKAFRDMLKDKGWAHEYIHPGTPEENGHIEAFHNTVEKLLCKRYDFDGIEQARDVFEGFISYYNNKRIMKALLYRSPKDFLMLWSKGSIGIKRDNKKQTYFFREKPGIATQAPLTEDFFKFVHCKVNDETNICLTTG